jgi:hypothetical protein
MSPEQRALSNKRRRDLYAHKSVARKLQITPQEKEVKRVKQQENEVKRKESKKTYKRMVREHRANNLHPDSIAMESPHFNPQLVFPSSPQSPEAASDDMEIPELTEMPIYIVPSVVQNPEVETPELATATHTIHRHRVTTRERNTLMSRRNQAFETSGRRARGCADGKCNDSNDPTQPSVVYNGK